MCRLLGYLGLNPILLGDLIDKPENSLINQSRGAREGCHVVNADGFGISWYNLDIDPNPGIFKSIQPAWNDKNLAHISKKVSSDSFLAHIRASTIGDVTFNNCHPFSYKEYSFAHNGTIRQFEHLRRDLINHIDEELFLSIKAQTDSEHLFFLIMHFLKKEKSLEKAVRAAYKWVLNKQKDENEDHYSKLNTITINGNEIVATRFASKNNDNLTLYYTTSATTSIIGDGKHLVTGIVVASEKLDDFSQNWIEVEPNSILVAKKKNDKIDYEINPIDL